MIDNNEAYVVNLLQSIVKAINLSLLNRFSIENFLILFKKKKNILSEALNF